MLSPTPQRSADRFRGWPAALMAALWLGVFPLWQDGSFSRITRAKYLGMQTLTHVTFVIAAAVLALFLIRQAWLRRQSLPLAVRPVRFHPLQAAALSYLGWMALSAWQGSLASELNSQGQLAVWIGSLRYEGLMTQMYYIGIFLCLSLMRPRLSPVLHVAAVTMILFFSVTVMQYAGLNPLGLFPEGLSVRTNYEFQGTIGNIDMVSGYLCLATPLLLGGFVLLERPRPLLLGGLCGVMLLLMIEVQSGLIVLAAGAFALVLLLLCRPVIRARAMTVLGGMLLCLSLRLLLGLPWLDNTADIIFPHEFSLPKLLPCLMALCCWYAAALLRRRPGRALPCKTVLIIATASLAAVLLLIYLIPLPQSAAGLWEFREILHGRPQDSFGSYRLGVWRHTLTFSQGSPVFGTGPDTFLYAMRRYLQANMIQLPESFDNPHNEYLAILSNCGRPALMLYLLLMGGLLVCSIRRGGRENLILAGGIAAFMLQGFFSFSICLVTPMFWAVCGMACAWCGPDATSFSTTPKG